MSMMQRQRWILLHPVFAVFVFAFIFDAAVLATPPYSWPPRSWVLLVLGPVLWAPFLVWLVHYWHRRQLKRHPGPPISS